LVSTPQDTLQLIKTLTIRKIWNYFRLILSYYLSQISGKVIHWGNPASIGIEPTTFCNLRCPECPSGLRSFTRPTGMLDLEHFKSFTDEVHRDLVYMLLYFQGEPFLNKQFLEMVTYASGKGIYTATSTNAHYLDDANAEATVRSGLSRLIISIDGTTQDTYSSYRVGGNLDKVIKGTENILAWRKKLNSKTPAVFFQFLVVKPNEHQIPDILALGKKMGVDKVLLKTAQIYDYTNGSDLIPENTFYSRYRQNKSGQWEIKNKLPNQCWKLWQGLEVTWDGKVLPCCFDKDAEFIMGELGKDKLPQIWNNKAYYSFRKQILAGRDKIEMCRNCTEGLKVWANA